MDKETVSIHVVTTHQEVQHPGGQWLKPFKAATQIPQ